MQIQAFANPQSMSKAQVRQRIKKLVARTNQERLLENPPEQLSDDEINYMDRAIEAWAWWSYDVGPQAPVSMADLLKMKKDRVLTWGHLLDLSNDQCMLIDTAVTLLTGLQREIIDIEYREGGSQEQKADRLRMNRVTYRDHLRRLQETLYKSLMPEIEIWRESIL